MYFHQCLPTLDNLVLVICVVLIPTLKACPNTTVVLNSDSIIKGFALTGLWTFPLESSVICMKSGRTFSEVSSIWYSE